MRLNYCLIVLFAFLATVNTYTQEIPLVYKVENTGEDCPQPPLPSRDELPVIEPLPDPFAWSDGTGRDTTFESWKCRRAEIMAEIEHYEIGRKPGQTDTIIASFSNGLLTVILIENDDTLTLTSEITLPEGEGPFPAVIGIGQPTGSLPGDIFTSRNIATISFNFSQVMAHTQNRGSEPINNLYPDQVSMGAYSAWSWGVSRLIDGLEIVVESEELPIDLNHLGITGCSFAGKMALFAGAFDERIALTIAQEPGGGGAAAWRVSETLGNVETLGRTSHAWFKESMFQYSNDVAKLPHDHHELMAMIAPRALLVLGNPDYEWLAEESGYVSCRAAHKVWKTFGIEDRFGFSIVAGHGHCQLPDNQYPEVEAFIEKFLLGNESTNTNVTRSPYENVDYERWTAWWGTDNPVFPDEPVEPVEMIDTVLLEAECATLGGTWTIEEDTTASNGNYVVVNGPESILSAPKDSASLIYFNFNVDTTDNFRVFARLNCATGDDDSYWLKIDNGRFTSMNGLRTSGWEWVKLNDYTLEKGEHTLTIGYRENGAKLDKISVSNSPYPPEGMGNEADNICEVEDQTVGLPTIKTKEGYSLGKSYPNPCNEKTTIVFKVPRVTNVSLKVYSLLGEEITELAGKQYAPGRHTLEFYTHGISKGHYLYTLKTEEFTATQKLIVL